MRTWLIFGQASARATKPDVTVLLLLSAVLATVGSFRLRPQLSRRPSTQEFRFRPGSKRAWMRLRVVVVERLKADPLPASGKEARLCLQSEIAKCGLEKYLVQPDRLLAFLEAL
jgi:hypothetical protein